LKFSGIIGRKSVAAPGDRRAPFLKQLLRPEALKVVAEWQAKADKIRY